MELDKEQLQAQLQEKGQTAIDTVSKPFKEWERMRNPFAGWTRVGLGLISPFILWSNSLVLLLLFIAAVFTHPYWFPAYKDKKDNPDIMTKLVDTFQNWTKKAPKEEQLLFYLPGIAIAVPYVCFLWSQNIFWGVFFLITGASYKILFSKWLLNNPTYALDNKKADTKAPPKSKSTTKKTDNKKAA